MLAVPPASPALAAGWYIGKIPDQPHNILLVDKNRIPERFRRQTVIYDGPESPGTIIVDKRRRILLLVGQSGSALQFGIAVGRDGRRWSGEATVGRKAIWPGWTPTERMRARDSQLPVHMPGGPLNPLGARALYLFRDGRDTLYRIHGTNEPWSIGKAASSGCIRMLNEHIFEMYASVPVGTRVVVI
jgi:lipoprotein-anchoring transpeptidase ErfK/SrfK